MWGLNMYVLYRNAQRKITEPENRNLRHFTVKLSFSAHHLVSFSSRLRNFGKAKNLRGSVLFFFFFLSVSVQILLLLQTLESKHVAWLISHVMVAGQLS